MNAGELETRSLSNSDHCKIQWDGEPCSQKRESNIVSYLNM